MGASDQEPGGVARAGGVNRTAWWQGLDGLPAGGLNLAHEAVDRHATGARADQVALRFLGRGAPVELTYAQLRDATNRFAHALEALGVQPGDRVFALLPRVPELYVAALGTLKARAVFCPLFAAFGPEPIRQRLVRGDAKVLITTDFLYDRKVAPIRDQVTTLEHVLRVERHGGPGPELAALLDRQPTTYDIAPTDPEDMALLHFTSGTTGLPKGAVHVHEAVAMHHRTGRQALGLRDGDVYWCTADPGWVTGTSYGIVAPLTCGVTVVVDESDFDAARWVQILAEQRVTVWYTAPTAIRMLMRAGDELWDGADLSALRFAASVGEPLDREAVLWGERVLGHPFHDNWWQTELGGIAIGNFPGATVKPGSMGLPLPGIEAGLVRREGGAVVEVTEPDVEGELALRPGWPSMFRAYLHDPERYAKCFQGGWYLSGDLAKRDSDGYYWFIGRADDMIKSSGHFIGPFEVEGALVEHDAVAEAAVIGIPDPTAGEVVQAHLVLKSGFEPTEELRASILAHARSRLGPAVAPRELVFAASLPHTRSGKILRRLLRARVLGLPEGDTSTLETP